MMILLRIPILVTSFLSGLTLIICLYCAADILEDLVQLRAQLDGEMNDFKNLSDNLWADIQSLSKIKRLHRRPRNAAEDEDDKEDDRSGSRRQNPTASSDRNLPKRASFADTRYQPISSLQLDENENDDPAPALPLPIPDLSQWLKENEIDDYGDFEGDESGGRQFADDSDFIDSQSDTSSDEASDVTASSILRNRIPLNTAHKGPSSPGGTPVPDQVVVGATTNNKRTKIPRRERRKPVIRYPYDNLRPRTTPPTRGGYGSSFYSTPAPYDPYNNHNNYRYTNPPVASPPSYYITTTTPTPTTTTPRPHRRRTCQCDCNRTCPRGAPGPPGDAGKPGYDGMHGQDGQNGMDAANVVPTVPVQSCRICPSGPNGEKGFAGVTGKSGKPGHEGKPGSFGESGRCGLPGMLGNMGKEGNVGFSGRPGYKGSPGIKVTKIAGPKGPFGRLGDIGDRGSDGLQGPFGTHGPSGNIGRGGKLGYKGPRGPRGALGNHGRAGDDAFYCACPLRDVDQVHTPDDYKLLRAHAKWTKGNHHNSHHPNSRQRGA